MKNKAFTLIELLVVIVIIALLSGTSYFVYIEFISTVDCTKNKEQHRKVVTLAETTYAFCSLNGSTYMNIGPGYGCRSQSNSGMTAKGVDATGKCTRKWDCKTDWAGRNMTAGLSSGHFATHAKAEFKQPHNTSGFIREDQWQNFIKPNYPEREGITNIRDKGDKMHIATYIGPSCSGGNFSNSAGNYLINEIQWP